MVEILLTLTKMIVSSSIIIYSRRNLGIPTRKFKRKESVLISDWYSLNDEYLNDEIEEKWSNIIKLRKSVNKFLEKARQGDKASRIIGNSLDAKVSLYTENKELSSFMKENIEKLEQVFIVSKLEIVDACDETFETAEEMKN